MYDLNNENTFDIDEVVSDIESHYDVETIATEIEEEILEPIISDEDTSDVTEVEPVIEPVVKPVVKPVSKMALARAIFERMYGQEGVERKHIIRTFISEASCTPAGASTYYQTIVTKHTAALIPKS